MRYVLRIFGVALILSGVVLFFWQDIREMFTDRVNDRVIEAYHQGGRNVELNPLESFITGIDDTRQVTSAEDAATAESDTSLAEFNMESVAGILSIESAGIREPVFKGPVTESNLKRGLSFVDAGDHVDMQNIPIAGHRVEGAGIRFNHLDRASMGDLVTFDTAEGIRTYEITDIFEVDPSQVEVLDQKEGAPQQLTLITCEDYNPETLLFEKRLIVKATIAE
ncbi:class A sortase [Salinicoccus hispanicus]|uniref:Sortase n=1 Tax=Salinicoccus hispanicus TaxID=157225 RepID=A0A6N8TVY6_9STAP|nr:class A sortase [Salinicoccus hispanicus]MXQ49850.1 sortase [Salinicoccus hispanicus]